LIAKIERQGFIRDTEIEEGNVVAFARSET